MGTYERPEELDPRYEAQGSEPTDRKMNTSYGRTPRRIKVASRIVNHGVIVAIPGLQAWQQKP
jgi:hypothetical protein